MLIVKNVRKTYVPRNMTVQALRDASLVAEPGEITVIYGPSGSGKSVLFNLIAGFERPDMGEIIYNGLRIDRLTWRELISYRRGSLGYCMQKNIIFPRMKVVDNIALPLLIRGVNRVEARRRAEDLARKLNIEYTLYREGYTLSGGEQRRVVLACSLVTDPYLLLIDEPTSGVDEENKIYVWKTIKERVGGNTVTLIASHDEFIKERADRLFKIERGITINM